MTGSNAEAEFSWPAVAFRISANGQDEGVIFAIKMMAPARQDEPASKIIGPIVLSGSPSSHYDLKLLRSNAGMGEYIAIVKVEDQAFNVLSDIGYKAIKVK